MSQQTVEKLIVPSQQVLGMRGKVWSAVRSAISGMREEMGRIVETDDYGMESVMMDGMARRISDRVVKELLE